jgi:hypothetical protein
VEIQISTKTDLTLEEAKQEYRELTALLSRKTFPDGASAWATSVLNRIHDRLDFLKTKIADEVTNGGL